MKHLHLIILLFFAVSLHAQSADSLQTDTLSVDTVIVPLPDSVYKSQLAALPYVVEMPYNQVVRTYILRYLKHPKQLARLHCRANYYFPLFMDVFGKYNIPYELCYLAIIESALNPMAQSPMGAAGIWQFMPSTGKLYGLEINSLIDERRDPHRATEAACSFLTNLYTTFGDWNLAIAAYNCGPGNVNKAIQRSGGKRDFWSIYPYLPHETRNYLPLYIAAAYVMNYAPIETPCLEMEVLTQPTDTLHIWQREHLLQVSSVLNIPIEDLRLLNPQYSKDIIPGGKAYSLCLPSSHVIPYLAQEDSILAYQAQELILNRREEIDLAQKTSLNGGYSINGVTYYKIKNGDTLGGIAKKFHCSVKQLKAWNGLTSDAIRAGKTLKIK